MSNQIFTTGIAGKSFEQALQTIVTTAKPQAVGLAVAYVSAAGFHHMRELLASVQVKNIRLVTDARDAVTHPTALAGALDAGWGTRIVDSLEGTFHPKLYIGGTVFDDKVGVVGTSMVLVSSANLSIAALKKNGECSYIRVGKGSASGAASWKECWDAGTVLTPEKLAAYKTYFAERNKKRPLDDLITLGVADTIIPKLEGKPAKGVKPPPSEEQAIETDTATAAWAGLQSFTGDYDLQVEFPRDAGEVLARLLSEIATEDKANVLCEDGAVRQFIFRYYENNGMWRLNVPNTTPGVLWARENKDGIALVEVENEAVSFRIIPPGKEMSDAVGRSLALGTWGQTITRLYGWY